MATDSRGVAVELLAPAGDWDCLRAAVANGADAVYFGMPRFNARMRADNFRDDELPDVVAFLHNHGVKAYVALNVLIFTDELPDAVAELQALHAAGVDAVIIQDVGLAEISRRMFPDLRVHASTQMTITSPEGVRFAESLGVRQVVLAREVSLRELEKFPPVLPLEVFVHGALCVAYSGQCLTSEALGRRSANRGECAQACRMPYELVVDGAVRDLGDKKYLLSPQDLAAAREIPDLIARGVVSFKIEGRLKSPEYVAAVTAVYRKAIDAALAGLRADPSPDDQYRLEMTFSRGLYSGWMHGVNHQKLVGARFGKKRGTFVGEVSRTGRDHVELDAPAVHLKPGDGVVFDTGGDTEHEQGGRIFEVRGGQLFFEQGKLDFSSIPAGTRVWKTSDPALDRELRKSFAGKIDIRPDRMPTLDFVVSGRAGGPLVLECRGITRSSEIVLEPARTRPLTEESLRAQLGKLGDTAFVLGDIRNELEGDVILPLSEINRLRREILLGLSPQDASPKVTLESILPPPSPPASSQRPSGVAWASCPCVENQQDMGRMPMPRVDACPSTAILPASDTPRLMVLCRSHEQLGAALDCGIAEVAVDYEDIRRYKEAVATVREAGEAAIFLATPRIQKAGEEGFFKLIENAAPDGVLIRNVGGISYFSQSPLRQIGDFSLNVANPATASVFHGMGIERLTISHDLNLGQILALLRKAPPDWFELTLHHHIPMFHMEHCVFAAFLSDGTDSTNCGRPCESHRVHLRDRIGMEHPLRADVGCRNTLFNAVPQSGAGFFGEFLAAGLRRFRIELLEETADETRRVIMAYQALLSGEADGTTLWRDLKARSQVGVTRGTYA
jgi:putative protease